MNILTLSFFCYMAFKIHLDFMSYGTPWEITGGSAMEKVSRTFFNLLDYKHVGGKMCV